MTEIAASLACPECGGPVDVMLTCHTYPQRQADGTERWMACMPCDSASDWYCESDECNWSWTEGLNPRNPRAAANDASRPSWSTPSENPPSPSSGAS
jgi:hypothetical protein